MVRQELLELVEDAPVIAAVKSPGGLCRCLECAQVRVVFLLGGTLLELPEMVARVRESGRAALVHVDLIDGLSAREAAVDYIKKSTRADGVISTKPQLIRRAGQLGLLAVQRFFLLDSIALEGVEKQLAGEGADFVEILPGVMPKIIRRIVSGVNRPVIAGGLISDKEDVLGALAAGAVAVSSTNENVWIL